MLSWITSHSSFLISSPCLHSIIFNSTLPCPKYTFVFPFCSDIISLLQLCSLFLSHRIFMPRNSHLQGSYREAIRNKSSGQVLTEKCTHKEKTLFLGHLLLLTQEPSCVSLMVLWGPLQILGTAVSGISLAVCVTSTSYKKNLSQGILTVQLQT